MYKEIIDRLLEYSVNSHLQVDFDAVKKVFIIKTPIFTDPTLLNNVKAYVIARKDLKFTPHSTSYKLEGEEVWLFQEIPFQLQFQDNLRSQIDLFIDMSKKCRRMLYEIAVEEKYKGALRGLDSHF